jgi:hypothetical protein
MCKCAEGTSAAPGRPDLSSSRELMLHEPGDSLKSYPRARGDAGGSFVTKIAGIGAGVAGSVVRKGVGGALGCQ